MNKNEQLSTKHGQHWLCVALVPLELFKASHQWISIMMAGSGADDLERNQVLE